MSHSSVISPAHLVAECGVEPQVPVEAGEGRKVAVHLLHHDPAVTGAHGGRAVAGWPGHIVGPGD